MKITYRIQIGQGGQVGSLLHPCFKVEERSKEEYCDSLMDCGSYVVLMRGGFTQHSVSKSDIIKITRI